MTRLIDKIHSYSIGNGIDFNQNYSGTAPTQYGPYTFGTLSWSFLSTDNGITGSTSDGAFPGQGYWNFRSGGPTNATARLRAGSTSSESSVGSNLVRPQNYTYGVWLRINEDITANVGFIRAMSQFVNSDPGNGELWEQGWWIGYCKDNNGASPTYGKLGFNIYTTNNDLYFFTDANGKTFEVGQWVFIALRKSNPNNTTVTMEVFINGGSMGSYTYPYSDQSTTYHTFGSGDNVRPCNFSVSSSFLASNTAIDATAINEIWDYGAPIQVPVKYYDGTAWQTSSNQKIYNGTKWIPMYANRWTGTTWVPL